MANELVTGVAIVKLNGKSIRSKEGATLKSGGYERSPQFADGQLVGYSAKPVESMVTATLLHTSISDLDAINNLTDGTITFVCDSGPIFTIANAFSTKPWELKSGDSSEVSVEFAGRAAVKSS